MHHSTRASLLGFAVLAASYLTASCSDTDARLASPSGIDTAALTVEPTSAVATAEPVIDSFCPSIPPFNVAFGLRVGSVRTNNLTVTGIRFRFTDTAGLQSPMITLPSPMVTLPAPGPTQIFGVPQVRTFPLVLGIGCGTGRRGTIVIIVDTVDGVGRTRSQQTMVNVR